MEFIKTCAAGCAGLLVPALLLQSCAGTKFISGEIKGSFLHIPVSGFETVKNGKTQYRQYIIAQNNQLQYPLVIFRSHEGDYQALLMKCTHQGTELQVFGDRLQCPAHGSEFTNSGKVQNGPADMDLRTFPVKLEENILKIDLS